MRKISTPDRAEKGGTRKNKVGGKENMKRKRIFDHCTLIYLKVPRERLL